MKRCWSSATLQNAACFTREVCPDDSVQSLSAQREGVRRPDERRGVPREQEEVDRHEVGVFLCWTGVVGCGEENRLAAAG